MLAVTLATHAVLTTWWEVRWLAGEDRLVEWVTVGLFVMAAVASVLNARALRRLGHRRLGLFHALLAALFLFVALEEISWGQRIFDWSTPEAISSINYQNETTIHNLSNFDRVSNSMTVVAAVLATAGGLVRLALHLMRRVTTADLILPSLVLVPALLLIVAWNAGGEPWRELADAVGPRPVGDEAPELLTGLCVVLYSWVVLTKVRALGHREPLAD